MAVGGLLLFVANYNINNCYYTTNNTDNCFNRNNYHSPLQKYSTKICDFNLISNPCGDGREVYRLFLRLKVGKRNANVFSYRILYHFCKNKSSYFKICLII